MCCENEDRERGREGEKGEKGEGPGEEEKIEEKVPKVIEILWYTIEITYGCI
jgi:hypothetical protein